MGGRGKENDKDVWNTMAKEKPVFKRDKGRGGCHEGGKVGLAAQPSQTTLDDSIRGDKLHIVSETEKKVLCCVQKKYPPTFVR